MSANRKRLHFRWHLHGRCLAAHTPANLAFGLPFHTAHLAFDLAAHAAHLAPYATNLPASFPDLAPNFTSSAADLALGLSLGSPLFGFPLDGHCSSFLGG